MFSMSLSRWSIILWWYLPSINFTKYWFIGFIIQHKITTKYWLLLVVFDLLTECLFKKIECLSYEKCIICISLDKCSFHNELYDVNSIWSPLPCVICQCREILENQTVSSVCYIKQCPTLRNCLGVWINKF
jgi:hypothetical protein